MLSETDEEKEGERVKNKSSENWLEETHTKEISKKKLRYQC